MDELSFLCELGHTCFLLRSLRGLKAAVQPIVIATHNDLVLCGTSEYFQRYYYICNPYTGQCVALPPTPSSIRDNTSGIHDQRSN
ncbi:hypothetical protein M0R45_011275 [Rubus argutus]|uniref:Uncharacterized protein n=1 Tax=Rubus argutus TaxID=59490 RepID=A0AAW1YCJ5_RUBAR